MREHVLKEVDSGRFSNRDRSLIGRTAPSSQHQLENPCLDGDTAISMAEFMAYIQTDEFINPTNKYKMIDELIQKGELYTSDELKEYR